MEDKEKGGGNERRARIVGGYVILPRALRDHPIRRMPPRYWALFTYLLQEARWDHEPYKLGGVTVNRGQLLRSFRKISEDNEWVGNRQVKSWSKSTIGRMLNWLEGVGEVELLGTELGTLITLRKFNEYQDPDSYRPQLGTELGTVVGRSRDNRKKEKKEKKPYTPAFESAWQVQRRGSKPKAFAEYLKAVPSVITAEELLRQWTAYDRLTVRPGFQGAHLHQWIKDERWEEDLAGAPPGTNSRPRSNCMSAAEAKAWAGE